MGANIIMEKPVIISIRGVQALEPGDEDIMELVTQGVLRQEDGEGFSLTIWRAN